MDTHREPTGGEDSAPSGVSDATSETRGTVAVVIPARNEASRIALTVLAALRLPQVGPVIVVDDGSTDSTARVAEESGARVVRQPEPLGRPAAQQRGVDTVRELAGTGRLCLLFLDADLGPSAAEAARLLEPVLSGGADLALGVSGGSADRARSGAAARRARAGVRQEAGFEASAPLSGELCLSAAAFAAAVSGSTPVTSGPGLIIDLVRQGFRPLEVPLDLDHRPGRRGLRAALREFGRYRAVGREVSARRRPR
jgi:Glycosyl transferase family 2